MRKGEHLKLASSHKTAAGGETRNAWQTLTALSLFSGGGGIDLGFSAAGFHIAAAGLLANTVSRKPLTNQAAAA